MPCKSEWQPIETAPKDGTIVLLYDQRCPAHGAMVGWWNDNSADYPWSFIDDVRPALTECCDNEDRERIRPNGFNVKHLPTHWMPLPEGPNEPQV